MSHLDEQKLRALFEEIEAPPGLDRWHERIADVHAEPVHEETNGAIIALPVGELRPKRQRKRSVATAAAAAVVVGLGGVVVATQLFSEAPPADPTMIIDGPDKTISSTPPSTSGDAQPSGSATAPQPPGSTEGRPGPGDTQDDEGGTAKGTADRNEPDGEEPTWPAMVGDPTAANTGVPFGASLGDHHGDLRITTAGQVVTDLRVTGSVIVDAPNVTLKRVLVVAPYGGPAVRQNAANLTVENSELSGGTSLTQSASGLVVRRSRLEAGVTVTSGAQLFDSYLEGADVLIPSRSATVLLRHNTLGQVTMTDLDAPITGVTIENNLLRQVDAPTAAGSAGIHVLGNRFLGSAPSTGWPEADPDYRWSNNIHVDSGAPAYP